MYVEGKQVDRQVETGRREKGRQADGEKGKREVVMGAGEGEGERLEGKERVRAAGK